MSERDRAADWQTNPVLERQVADVARGHRARRRWAWGLAVGSLGLCPLACLGPCAALSSSPSLGIVLPLGAIVVFAALLRAYGLAGERSLENALALRRDFSDVPGWFVELRVFQGQALTGLDLGTVWFEEDRMFFTGTRTSFGLGLDDTAGGESSRNVLADANASLVLPLRASTEAGSVAIALRFLNPSGSAHDSEESFRSALRGWLHRATHSHGGLPPLMLGVDLPTLTWLRGRAILAYAVWPLLLALVLATARTAPVLTVLLVGLGLLISVVRPDLLSPRLCARALRDRKRLTEGE